MSWVGVYESICYLEGLVVWLSVCLYLLFSTRTRWWAIAAMHCEINIVICLINIFDSAETLPSLLRAADFAQLQSVVAVNYEIALDYYLDRLMAE